MSLFYPVLMASPTNTTQPATSVDSVKTSDHPHREQTWPVVCVFATVRNEERYLEAALDSVLGQHYPGQMRFVLSVGPSHDNTYGIAAEYSRKDPRLYVIDNPTGLIPHGLNTAINAAPRDTEMFIRFDGHTRLPENYVKTMVETLLRTGADNVGGRMRPVGKAPLEQAIAWGMSNRLGIGAASFHIGGVEGPEETAYLGSFRREAVEQAGLYDEQFHRAEDWELNYRIRRNGGLVWFKPDIEVEYRPRSTWRALARQFYDTGGWRREVIRKDRRTASLRYLAAPLATAANITGLALGILGLITPWWPLLLGLAAPCGYMLLITVGGLIESRGLPAAARIRVPGVLATMHMCWGAGFLRGRKDR
ncbi:glycosyltransferase family 2 protein [Jonesia quinghaiensis]|uniref:glycosyltransferase family 2 protein n=1 Tax=Jonesia quinghaiensis TaxID=262806 RepID=UPI001FE12588|nr:glycosyltransferase family 2 protein [Jonesia quinghaiensis]